MCVCTCVGELTNGFSFRFFFKFRDRSTLCPKMTKARLTWLLITCHRRWLKKKSAPYLPLLAKLRVASSYATKSQVLILRSMMVDNLSTVWNFFNKFELPKISKNQRDSFRSSNLFCPFPFTIWKQGRVWATDSSTIIEPKMLKKQLTLWTDCVYKTKRSRWIYFYGLFSIMVACVLFILHTEEEERDSFIRIWLCLYLRTRAWCLVACNVLISRNRAQHFGRDWTERKNCLPMLRTAGCSSIPCIVRLYWHNWDDTKCTSCLVFLRFSQSIIF